MRLIPFPFQTALHFAAFYQHPEVCRLLCSHGAPLNALDRKGRRPAMDTRSDTVRAVIVGFERRHQLRAALLAATAAAAIGAAAFYFTRRTAPPAPAGR
jgi:hypothetical protein